MDAKRLGNDSTQKFAAWIVAILLGTWISSCDGGSVLGGGQDDSCRSHDECNSGDYCRGPNHPQACGIAPRELCASDADCVMGLVCHAVDDPCSPDGLGSECNPPCTATSCAPGLRCNATGACEPIPCDEGFTCPDWQTCDSAVAHAMAPVFQRSNGCVNIDCTNDTACPSGKSCVNGYCQDGPGTCQEDIAVP